MERLAKRPKRHGTPTRLAVNKDHKYVIDILNSTADRLLTPDPDMATGIIPDPVEWQYSIARCSVHFCRTVTPFFTVLSFSYLKVEEYTFEPYEVLEFLGARIPKVRRLLCTPF